MREFSTLPEEDQQRAMERYRLLQPHLEQGRALAEVAEEAGVPYRTARQWATLYRQSGLAALAPQGRTDAGSRRRLTVELQKLIEGLALRKPRLSAASIHREVSRIAQLQGEKPPSYSLVYDVIRRLLRRTPAPAEAASPAESTHGLEEPEARLLQLYDAGYLYQICLRFLIRPEEAEDAAGDVFVLAWQRLGGFRGYSAFDTWIYRIASNHCLNCLRGARSVPWEEAATDDPSHTINEQVYHQQLLRAIEEQARLGKRPWDDVDYQIFKLYFNEEKPTWNTVSATLGLPVDTVKYHYYRHVLPTLRAVAADFDKD